MDGWMNRKLTSCIDVYAEILEEIALLHIPPPRVIIIVFNRPSNI